MLNGTCRIGALSGLCEIVSVGVTVSVGMTVSVDERVSEGVSVSDYQGG